MSQHDETGLEHDEDDDLVVLPDQQGNDVSYRFLAVVDVDEQEFALLTPVADEDSDELTIFIFKYEDDEDEGVEHFTAIDAGPLFDRVVARAEQLIRFVDEDGEE